ncbi:MAG: hypothetical protein HKM04_00920 [Legionellales bacterium]|nr:hypothetical protein [Legionellales bacterium]
MVNFEKKKAPKSFGEYWRGNGSLPASKKVTSCVSPETTSIGFFLPEESTKPSTSKTEESGNKLSGTFFVGYQRATNNSWNPPTCVSEVKKTEEPLKSKIQQTVDSDEDIDLSNVLFDADEGPLNFSDDESADTATAKDLQKEPVEKAMSLVGSKPRKIGGSNMFTESKSTSPKNILIELGCKPPVYQSRRSPFSNI